MGSPIETLIRSAVTKGVDALSDFNRKRMPTPAGDHPFLTKLHTPMDEELTLSALEVSGAIPAGLCGRYMRIGPTPGAADPA